jgi:type IV pilus assembly protein PilB
MHVSESELKEFVLDSGLVSRKELEEASAEATRRERPLEDVLVSRGAIDEDAMRRVQAYVLGIPFINLAEQYPSLDVLALIPEPIARSHNLLAFKKDGDTVEVALLAIEDLSAADAVRKKSGLRFLPRLTDVESMARMLVHYQKLLKGRFGDLIKSEAAKLAKDRGTTPESIAGSAPILHIVDTLLRHAVTQGASDIHLEPAGEELLVRYRIDGTLNDAMALPSIVGQGIIARLKELAHMKLGAQAPQEGRFLMETDAERVSFRLSTLPTARGERVTLQVLAETGEGFTLEALGFHGEGLERIYRALREKSGLVLVAGPAGNGKTTTLYALLDILNSPRAHLATIEDPVEHRLPRASQTQVDAAQDFTFAAGLRALLRQDPDVVMVGDVRDAETAALAVSAAASGRLVLAGINAESAAEAVRAMLDFGIAPSALAATLRVVIAQRLVRRLSPAKQPRALAASERNAIANMREFSAALEALRSESLLPSDAGIDDLVFYQPSPTNGGYAGYAGINEVMALSPALRESILRSGTAAALAAEAKREGMLTLLEDGIYAAARGLTSLDEVADF